MAERSIKLAAIKKRGLSKAADRRMPTQSNHRRSCQRHQCKTNRSTELRPASVKQRSDLLELPDISVLRLSNPPPPTFPLEVFGNRWAQWIKDAGAAAACPPDYVVAALLPAASALIGHARWAQAWPGWQEPPHLWCVSVGHSGQGKSPGADLILRHLVPAIEARMVHDHGFKSDVQLALLKAHPSDRPANVVPSTFAVSSVPSRDLMTPRFMESDLTIEKVAEVLSHAAPKGLLMVRDELAGWLLGMNRFNAAARAFWLEAYGGRPYSLDRVKSAGRIYIRRLAVAWHGGIQPQRLAKLMADPDDGLLARFIWFWPDPIPFRRPNAAPITDFALSAFERLSLLDLRSGNSALPENLSRNPADSTAGPIMVPLCEEAAGMLEAFAQKIQGQQSQSIGLMTSALGKTRGLVLRLSLVLQYLRWAAENGMAPAPAEIGAEALHAAIMLTTKYLIPMARRVYGTATVLPEDRRVETLARWIVHTKASEVYVRHLQRHERLPGLATAAHIHGACCALVKAGWLIPPSRGSNKGRAKQAYRVKSAIWTA